MVCNFTFKSFVWTMHYFHYYDMLFFMLLSCSYLVCLIVYFMKIYFLLYYLAYLGVFLPFFFLMKSKRGRRVCVLLKISGYEEVMDCKRKGEIYSFMVGLNFQEILSSSKRGSLKKCLPP